MGRGLGVEITAPESESLICGVCCSKSGAKEEIELSCTSCGTMTAEVACWEGDSVVHWTSDSVYDGEKSPT